MKFPIEPFKANGPLYIFTMTSYTKKNLTGTLAFFPRVLQGGFNKLCM
jgi:hypothetical protein